MTKILALFPGQGSQAMGMGKSFYDASEKAQEMFAEAEKALGFSLADICFTGPEEKLQQTAITQPAILTVSCICFEHFFSEAAAKVEIVAAAGHSLGEYSALVAANALDFSDAVQLVHKRGQYMQEAVPAGHGKMLAVLGKEADALAQICSEIEGIVEIANINAPGQIVVAGEAKAIDTLSAALTGTKVVPLAVSAPFHCQLMKPAADKLKKDIDAISFRAPSFPVYSNVDAQPLASADAVKDALFRQVCGQVRWVESMENSLQDKAPDIALEFGHGTVLQGLLKRIDRKFPRTGVSEPESIASVLSNTLSA